MSGTGRRSKLFEPPAAFLLTAAVFLLILLRNGILPFGGTTLLFSDLDSQYVQFMAEYRRILLGQGDLTWSWHAGMGMNFLALTAYYLSSPFNFLLILFPEDALPLAVSLLTTLKLGCAGAAFAFYLRSHYQKTPGLLTPVFGAAYALSAYALGYSFNIMWLDALIWLPLLCAGIDRLLSSRGKGMALLTLLLALSFLSQFYMAWMTGIFCALYFLAQLILREDPVRTRLCSVLRFAVCVGTAMGLSAILLVPTFFVLKNNMGLLGQSLPAVGGKFPFPSLFQKTFIGSFDGIKDCLPHIYCGIPALTGAVLFFKLKEILLRKKLVSGAILLLLLFSFWFAPLDFFWHAMDHPSWFPYRYAFLFCFWLLTLAYEGFTEDPAGRYSPAVIGVCAALLLCAVLTKSGGKLRFLLLNGVFLAVYALPLRKFSLRFDLLPPVFCLELLLNGCLIISGYRDGYTPLRDLTEFRDRYAAKIRTVMPAGTDFYRMEKESYRTFNDPLGLGYPGITHFSSTASARQARYLKQLGFNCYATWCNYQGATAVTDALLRIRYEFADDGKQGSLPAGEGIWEHPALFPLFYFAEEAFARYDFHAETDSLTRQNDLLQLLAGEDGPDFFEAVPAEIVRLENLEPDGKGGYLRIDESSPAWLEAEINPDPARSLYLYLPGASLSYTVTVSGTELMNGNRDYAPFPMCLDPYDNGEKILIRVETLKKSLTGGLLVYALDTQRLSELSERISAAAPRTEKTSGTSFLLTTEAADRDRLVVSSVPFDAGWQVTADGRPLERKMIHESVLGFVLPAGCDTVTVSYQAYGMKLGMILSGCAALLWIAMIIMEKRKK